MLVLYHDGTRSMAAGLFSIADRVDRAGHPVLIIHAELERERDPNFDIAAQIAALAPTAVGFSLHWAHQAPAIAAAVRTTRQALPEAVLFAGGLTASSYGPELLAALPELDAVIRGDGELPTLRIVEAIDSSGENGCQLDGVPNIVQRRTPLARHSFTMAQADIKTANYGRIDLLQHGARLGQGTTALRSRFLTDPMRFQPAGKGCAFQCLYCGGSRSAQDFTSARKTVLFRPPDRIESEIAEAVSQGANSFLFCFDPAPAGKFYPKLFDRLGKTFDRALQVGFSSWRLPPPALVQSLSRNFSHAYVEISPEVADDTDRLRAKGKGASFTNVELFDTLDDLNAQSVGAELYFSYFHSPDVVGETMANIALIQQITARYGFAVNPVYLALSSDPSSARMRFGEKGFDLKIKGMSDFIALDVTADFRSNVMAYQPSHLDAEGFDIACLRIEAFNRLHSGLTAVSRWLFLALEPEPFFALLTDAATLALGSGTRGPDLVRRTLHHLSELLPRTILPSGLRQMLEVLGDQRTLPTRIELSTEEFRALKAPQTITAKRATTPVSLAGKSVPLFVMRKGPEGLVLISANPVVDGIVTAAAQGASALRSAATRLSAEQHVQALPFLEALSAPLADQPQATSQAS